MKKKGFTLVELLAVIVILAVIALIATPTILGVIDKAKRSSLQDSGYGLVEAANLYYAQYSNSKTIRFDIEDNKITTEEENKLNYKGNIKNGTVLINDKGEVTVCINDGKHAAYKNYKDSKVTVVDSKTCTIPESSYIVYLDDEATITEMTNQELTQEIENLKKLIEEQNEKIESLQNEKSNQIDVTTSINNLSSQHASDINLINSNINTINGTLSNMNQALSILNSTETLTYTTGYDPSYIEWLESKVTKVGNQFYIMHSILNIKITVPDGQGLFSYDSSFSNGHVFIIQPNTGNIYPVRLVDGTAKAWGEIPVCSNCFMFGIYSK